MREVREQGKGLQLFEQVQCGLSQKAETRHPTLYEGNGGGICGHAGPPPMPNRQASLA